MQVHLYAVIPPGLQSLKMAAYTIIKILWAAKSFENCNWHWYLFMCGPCIAGGQPPNKLARVTEAAHHYGQANPTGLEPAWSLTQYKSRLMCSCLLAMNLNSHAQICFDKVRLVLWSCVIVFYHAFDNYHIKCCHRNALILFNFCF